MALFSSHSVPLPAKSDRGGCEDSAMQATESKQQQQDPTAHWSQMPAKSILTRNFSKDLEQPPTPLRASSGSCRSLAMQYSDDVAAAAPDPPELLAAKVASLKPLPVPFSSIPGPLVKQQEQVKQQAEQQQQPGAVQLSTNRQAAAVVVACLAWVLVSSATILINKRIMVDLSFHFPAAVSALGMLSTTAGSFLVCCVLGLVPCRVRVTPYFFFTRILTTGFLIALSFQAGNTAYLYLSVAFVQMLKAFTPVSTMAAGFLFGLEQPSAKLMAAVGCISAGVLVSSYGELNFSVFGVAAMMASIAAEGLRTALMQHLLASKQFHPLEAWLYLGPACLIWLTVLVGVSEVQQIHDTQAFGILAAHPWHCAFAALAGFAVNALAMSVIHLASALTLKVLGVCKDVGLVACGVLLLGEHIGGLQVCGYVLALCGFTAYNAIKLTGPLAPQAADLSRQSAGGKDSKDAAQQFSHSHSSHSSRQLAQQQHSGLTAMYFSVMRGEAPSLGRSSLTEPLLAPALHP